MNRREEVIKLVSQMFPNMTLNWESLLPHKIPFCSRYAPKKGCITKEMLTLTNEYFDKLASTRKGQHQLQWVLEFAMKLGIPLWEAIQWIPLQKSANPKEWYELAQSMPTPEKGWFLRGLWLNAESEQTMGFIAHWIEKLDGCDIERKREFLEFIADADEIGTSLSSQLLLAKIFGLDEVKKGENGYALMLPVADEVVSGKAASCKWENLKEFLCFVFGDAFYGKRAIETHYAFESRLFQVFFDGLALDVVKAQHQAIQEKLNVSRPAVEWILCQKSWGDIDVALWQPFVNALGEQAFMKILDSHWEYLMNADFVKQAAAEPNKLQEAIRKEKEKPKELPDIADL